MDKGTFDYTGVYYTSLRVEDYCSMADSTRLLASPTVVTAALPEYQVITSSATQSYIKLQLKNDLAQRLFHLPYKDQDAFNQQFKGLYITTDFGSATVLYVTNITLALYYHFTYQLEGRDTTVNDVKALYANSEVRRVNRVNYTWDEAEQQRLQQNKDTSYIVSPAHIYTTLRIPLQGIAEHINTTVDGKRPYVNRANMQIDVLNVYAGSSADKTVNDWAQPASNMLLVKYPSLDDFLQHKDIMSDTCAILSSLTSGTDSLGNTIYYYSYDLSSILTEELRGKTHTDTLDMLLVPVAVKTTTTSSSYYYTSTSVTEILPLQTISATAIRSASLSVSDDIYMPDPLNLKVIFSGF